jgi:hypothetical protein
LRKDRIDRLHDFRNSIARQIEKFERTVPIDLFDQYSAFAQQIRDDCVNIREDIRWWRKKRFDTARRICGGLSQQDIENKDVSCIMEGLWPTDNKPKEMKPLCDYERGRKLILGLLTELHDLSW